MTIRVVLGLLTIVGSTWGLAHEQNKDYYHGTVSGYDFHEYHLQLIKGDRLTAVLKSTKLEVIMFKPIAKILTNNEKKPTWRNFYFFHDFCMSISYKRSK